MSKTTKKINQTEHVSDFKGESYLVTLKISQLEITGNYGSPDLQKILTSTIILALDN